MTADSNKLFVIGAGQMRTGTTSLKSALEKLYGGKVYHMDEILFNGVDHIGLWIKALDQGHLCKELSEEIFTGYCAAVDNPTATFYQDLIEIYPDAKVILTTRNSDDWVKSVRSTIIRKGPIMNILEKISLWNQGIFRFEELCVKLRWHSFHVPYEILQYDDEVLKESFEKYNERVRQTVPKERLLEFNAKDGWTPLCEFLDLPIPNEPFPFVNNSEEFIDKIKSDITKTLVKFGSITVLLTFGILHLFRYVRP